MSNEQTLPVYVVPGTDGNPDVYYLRSFTSDPDTQISKEQYDGLTAAITAAGADLQTLHAQADPASPDFIAPAVNADVAGSAASPTSQPVQTPSVGEDVSATEEPAGEADQSAPEQDQSGDTVANPGIVVQDSPEPETTAGTAEVDGGQETDNFGTVLPGGDVQSPEANSSNGDGTAEPGVPAENTGTEAPVQQETEGENTVVADQSSSDQSSAIPNESTSPDQSQSSGSSAEPDPNENSQAPEPSLSTSEVSDPTDPSVVAGQPLPPSAIPSDPSVQVTDPATQAPADTTDHPIDSTTLPDPTVVQAPPADLPAEEHGSWFAKEKQRILDILKSESDRVSSEQAPE